MQSTYTDLYNAEVVAQLQKELGLKNTMEVPRIKKICVNVGMGSYLQKMGKNAQEKVEKNLALITGQKPVVKKSRLSVSNFKVREGMPVGAMVTLRGKRASNFLYKMIHVVYPRVRGFMGVKKNIFDAHGNCSIGFNDYTVFPETPVDDSGKPHGLQVTIVIDSKDPAHSRRLLEVLKFPFRK